MPWPGITPVDLLFPGSTLSPISSLSPPSGTHIMWMLLYFVLSQKASNYHYLKICFPALNGCYLLSCLLNQRFYLYPAGIAQCLSVKLWTMRSWFNLGQSICQGCRLWTCFKQNVESFYNDAENKKVRTPGVTSEVKEEQVICAYIAFLHFIQFVFSQGCSVCLFLLLFFIRGMFLFIPILAASLHLFLCIG